MQIARLVHYEGYVQGVGFRYAATTLSQRFHVTGYVMNMPDGSVDVCVEGPAEEVEGFLTTLGEEMAEYIRNSRIEDMAPTGQFRRFSVRY